MSTVTLCCTTEMIFLPCGKPRGKRNNLKMRKLKGNPSQLHPNIKCQPNVICIPYADKQVKHITGFWRHWILDRSFQNEEFSKFQDILFQHCHIKNKQKESRGKKFRQECCYNFFFLNFRYSQTPLTQTVRWPWEVSILMWCSCWAGWI